VNGAKIAAPRNNVLSAGVTFEGEFRAFGASGSADEFGSGDYGKCDFAAPNANLKDIILSTGEIK
jgi:hypothetical protein